MSSNKVVSIDRKPKQQSYSWHTIPFKEAHSFCVFIHEDAVQDLDIKEGDWLIVSVKKAPGALPRKTGQSKEERSK